MKCREGETSRQGGRRGCSAAAQLLENFRACVQFSQLWPELCNLARIEEKWTCRY
jgi:hypothetical protein